MRFFSFLFLFCFLSSPSLGAVSPKYALSLQNVPLASLSTYILRDVFKQDFFLDPAVSKYPNLVTFSVTADKKDFLSRYFSFLKTLGFRARRSADVVYIEPDPDFVPAVAGTSVFVYEPLFRSPSYLISAVTGVFRGSVGSVVSGAGSAGSASTDYSPTSARALQDNHADALVFEGLPDEVAKLKRLLPSLDVPAPEVFVRAYLYEVTKTKSEGSAFSFAVGLLKKNLSLSLGLSEVLQTGSIVLSSGTFDAAISALNSDARFKVLSSPSVRVSSGQSASFQSGEQVPVLSSTTFTDSGTTQSVQYRDSGVIFTVTPQVFQGVINLTVRQELSDFVQTTTGVNNSPTLNQRSLSSVLALQDGQAVLIGGLSMDKSNDGSEGLSFLPSALASNTSTASSTEILLVLVVDRVKVP